MKKSFFTLVVLFMCGLLTAQFLVWRNGQIVYQSDINEVDSITLYEYIHPDTPTDSKYIVVKAKVPSSWDVVTAWIWATDEEGREVRATRDGDWWVVLAQCDELNVIFKNGWGWNGDVNQTEEITGIKENVCYQLKQVGAQKATATAVDCPDVEYTLTVGKDYVELLPNEEYRINFTFTPQFVNEIYDGDDLEFISSNEDVAIVSDKGVITAVSEGTATITVRIKGYESISADINVTVLSPIAKVEFYNVELYGFYSERQYPLSYMSGSIDENGDTVYAESNDINGDGEPDYVREAVFYIVANGVYMSQYGLEGEENYVVFIRSACPYDGTYVYPFGFYQFSADPDSFLVDYNGDRFMKWTDAGAYASYTNFNPTSYAKYFHDVLFSNGEWPATQADYDAFKEEYGYWYGDYDSYVGYLRTPEGSEAYVQETAGLVTGGIGFAYDWDEEGPYMPFLDIDVEFFSNLNFYGLAREQAKDEGGNLLYYDVETEQPTTVDTGEPYMTYATEGEGEAETCVMAPTIKRHFSVGDACEYKSASRKNVRKAAPFPLKGISEKRIMANTLLNIPMKNILLKR